MLLEKVTRLSMSPSSSHVLLIMKNDGSLHFCIDYRALNTVIFRDRFPISTVDELLDEQFGTPPQCSYYLPVQFSLC